MLFHNTSTKYTGKEDNCYDEKIINLLKILTIQSISILFGLKNFCRPRP